MSKGIKPEDLGEAIADQLTLYHQDKVERVNAAGEKAIKSLVKKTKARAPKGKRGNFKKAITYTEKTNKATGDTEFTWGAKPPESRLTHLLANGHATRDGGRTKGNPFLQDSLDEVLPEYENDVEEALKND